MLMTCGINHHTAPLSLRERVTFRSDHFPHSLYELMQQPFVEEALILSTCNRTELYCKTQVESSVVDWLLHRHSLAWKELKPHLYVYKNEKVIQHILRVASGLDSMIVGESQIFGQLKQAFVFAREAGTLGKHLHPLFEYTFSIAKTIRSETAIGCHPVSFAYAITMLAKRIFNDIKKKTVLLLGAGDVIEKVAYHFHEQDIYKLIIANRTEEKAKLIAARFGGMAIGLSEVEKNLIEADIVVTALSASLPLIGKGLIERTLKKRKRSPQLLVDLGVPRNMEPEIASLEDAYLYCLDDLQQIIKEGLQSRRQAAEQAELLIEEHTSEFTRRMRAREMGKVISQVRCHAEKIRDTEIEKALKLLARGEEPQIVLASFATLLTNKLMHPVSSKLYQAGYENQIELIETIKYLFSEMDK